MKTRSYLTFQGRCAEAVALYERAFDATVQQILRFGDLPPNPAFSVPDAYKDKVLQCTLTIGDDFIRLSDCGPGQPLNDPESERLSIAVEASVSEIRNAFAVLSENGRVGMPLTETFYSPCTGVVFDPFGVMWNLVADKEK